MSKKSNDITPLMTGSVRDALTTLERTLEEKAVVGVVLGIIVQPADGHRDIGHGAFGDVHNDDMVWLGAVCTHTAMKAAGVGEYDHDHDDYDA